MTVDPLPPDLEALLDAERQRPGLPHAALERIQTRLAASIAAPASKPSFLRSRGVFGLTTFVLGVLVGALLVGVLRPPRPMPAPAAPPPIRETPAPAAPVTAPPQPTPAIAPVPTAPPPRAATTAPPRAPATVDDRDLDLAAERALVDLARAGVARNQHAAALEALERHLQKFPRGRLAEERDMLWVQALVQAGRHTDARARAAAFRRRYPRSLLLPAIDAALANIRDGSPTPGANAR
jgi:hypothetical protein